MAQNSSIKNSMNYTNTGKVVGSLTNYIDHIFALSSF